MTPTVPLLGFNIKRVTFDELNSGKIKNNLESETRIVTKPGDVGSKTSWIDRAFWWASLIIYYGLHFIHAFDGNQNFI